MKKIYTIEVTMTVKKKYTVASTNEDEVIEDLQEAGIVTANSEADRTESYNEEYNVVSAKDWEEGTVVDVG